MKNLAKQSFYLLLASFVLVSFTSCKGDSIPEKKEEKIYSLDRPLGTEIEVNFDLVANNYKGESAYLSNFEIINRSQKEMGKEWAIYWHQPRDIRMKTVEGAVKITHINGDYFKVEPTDSAKSLKTGESMAFSFQSDWWIIKEVDAPTGLYIVYTDSSGLSSKPELIENVHILPIVSEKQTNRIANDPLKVLNGKTRFEANAKRSFSDASGLCPIMPTPIEYTAKNDSFELSAGKKIAYASGFKKEAEFLKTKIKTNLGLDVSTVEGSEGDIVLDLSKVEVDSNTTESYTMSVSSKGIKISSATNAGVFYGIQSLRALFPVDGYAKGKSVKITGAEVKDAPRFEYRGMHLDVVRNFQKKKDVLRLLDLMAYYKLNKFHFHICDDEGWRVQIKDLPELTDIGSKRGHTKDESDMLNPAYGSGPYPDANKSWGTGYYTTDEFVEILKYAKERHIEVIPELDFPGHARAAIISMKARFKKLMAAGKENEARKYMLHEPGDASSYKSVQLYDDNVICVCQEPTYNFLEKVVDEMLAMYKTAGVKLKMVHIGGDEVPHPTKDSPKTGAWMDSPKCKKLLAAEKGYEKPEQLFYYFVDRFSKILKDRGIVTGGWEEIGMKKVENKDGDLIPEANEKFVSRGFVPYVWNTVWGWGAEDRGYKMANAGYKVVLSNVNNNYFDLAYEKDPYDPGYYWGGFVDTRTSWGFTPMDIYKGELVNNMGAPVEKETIEGKARLTETGIKNIYGLQGQLWSETVKGPKMMEYYLFPKMLGLVERAWAAQPQWATISDDAKRKAGMETAWNSFASRVGHYELPRLTYLAGGVNYRIAPPGAVKKDGKLSVNGNYPGFIYRYTTDGSDPTKASTEYTKPVEVSDSVQVKVAAFNALGRSSRITTVK